MYETYPTASEVESPCWRGASGRTGECRMAMIALYIDPMGTEAGSPEPKRHRKAAPVQAAPHQESGGSQGSRVALSGVSR